MARGDSDLRSLLAFVGVLVVVAYMSALLLGPRSPLRSSATASNIAPDMVATSLMVAPVVFVAIAVVLAGLWFQTGTRT